MGLDNQKKKSLEYYLDFYMLKLELFHIFLLFFQPLLDFEGDSALLPITALVHGYCLTNPRCGEDEIVERIITMINDKIKALNHVYISL